MRSVGPTRATSSPQHRASPGVSAWPRPGAPVPHRRSFPRPDLRGASPNTQTFPKQIRPKPVYERSAPYSHPARTGGFTYAVGSGRLVTRPASESHSIRPPKRTASAPSRHVSVKRDA